MPRFRRPRGRIVCYLSDDDLYLPDHVELLLDVLQDADFACSLPLWIKPGGEVDVPNVDLSLPYFRRLIEGGRNRVSLTNGAHTLAFYRSLPYGWRTTPQGIPTDLYMWQQLLSVDGVAPPARACTTFQYPNPAWKDLPWNMRRAAIEDGFKRCHELAAARLRRSALACAGRERALFEAGSGSELEALRRQKAALAVRMESMRTSVFWQARERLLDTPVLGTLGPKALATSRRSKDRGG